MNIRRWTNLLMLALIAMVGSVFLTSQGAQAGGGAFDPFFSPSTVGVGDTTTLTYQISNFSGAQWDDMAFTDSLPAGLVIATPPSATNACQGTFTAPAGGSLIELTGARLGHTEDCSLSVNVMTTASGFFETSPSALTYDGGSESTFGATINVSSEQPNLTKSFAPPTIPLGATSTLTFVVENSASETSLANFNFSDALPSGMAVANPPNASHTCPPFTTYAPTVGATTVSADFNGFQSPINPGDSCELSVDVITTGAGSFDNVTSTLSYNNNQPGGFATATLNVVVDTLNKLFVDDPATIGGTATLQFDIMNPSRTETATNIAFTDDLDSALTGLVATGLPASVCGGTLSGTSVLTFAGGVLAPEGSCSFSVVLDVPAGATPGTYTNTTSVVTMDLGPDPFTGNPATDDLTVNLAPTFTKEFIDDPVGSGGAVTLRFTIVNNDATQELNDVAFIDPLPDELSGGGFTSTSVCVTGTAQTTSGAFDEYQLRVSGINIPAAGTCTFDWVLDVLEEAGSGIYENETGPLTGTFEDLSTVEIAGASDTVEIVGGPEFLKEFTDDPVLAGATVTLDFTLTHPIAAPGLGEPPVTPITNIAFSDDLDATLSGLVATGLPLAGCGGTLSTTDGGASIDFSGGGLIAGEECTMSLTLQVPAAAASGSYTNTTSSVSAEVAGTVVASDPASDDLIVAGLLFTKEFLTNPVAPGGTTTLRFTIDNVSSVDATSILFTDSLANILPGAPDITGDEIAVNDVCGTGGNLTWSGPSFLFLSGGNLLAGTSCTFDVLLTVPGTAEVDTHTNTTSSISAMMDGSTIVFDPASAQITVEVPLGPVMTKEFLPSTATAGSSVSLKFTIENQNDTEDFTDLEFSDDLDDAISGMEATGAVTNECGGMAAGFPTGLFSYGGGSLAAGASCVVEITVLIPAGAAASTYLNTSSVPAATAGGITVTGAPGTDELTVTTLVPTFTKMFDTSPVQPGRIVNLEFTIDNALSTTDAVSLDFFDDIDAGVAVVPQDLPLVDPCGAGSLLDFVDIGGGDNQLQFTDGNLVAGSSCTFSVDLLLPLDAVTGVYPNVTSDLTESGLTVAAPAADDLIVVVRECLGLLVTVDITIGEKPTNGDDVIIGSSGPDTIDGRGGNDTICGGAGDDVINGGNGLDDIDGGSGNDTIDGGAGGDTIRGSGGTDSLFGGSGNDKLFGGADSDDLRGQNGNDILRGQGGVDRMLGGDGDDTLYTSTGGNVGSIRVVDGQGGNDTIYGGSGADILNGGDGNDVIFGAGDNDVLLGGNGDDILRGQGGDDDLDGEGDVDLCHGGSGTDIAQPGCETLVSIEGPPGIGDAGVYPTPATGPYGYDTFRPDRTGFI